MFCLGVVLAGGQSSRMGQNKAFLSLNNQTMLEKTRQLLEHLQVDKTVISGANSGGESDIVSQGGPLAGIYSLAQKYQPKAILAVPVDMPFLTAEHLRELKIKGELSGRATYFNDSPLPLYLPINAFVEDYLQQQFTSQKFLDTGKGPSFKQVLKLTNATSLKTKQQFLTNTNTPQEWQQVKQILT